MPLSRGPTAVLALCLLFPVAARTAEPAASPAAQADPSEPSEPQDCSKCPSEGTAASSPACAPCAAGVAPRAKGRTAGTASAAPAAEGAVTAGGLQGAAAGAGTAGGLGRAFDGGAGGEAGGVGAVSYVPAATPAGGAQSAETRFSAAFNTKLASVLSAYPAGRETLDRQRAADGTLKLPPVALCDSGGTTLGVFDRYAQTPTMELDRRNLAAVALASVPEAERAALQRQWRDPSKLAGYLADHPDALAAVASHYDTTYVHELTHGWQARRDRPVDIAADVDPKTRQAREPIEWEIEAYREEMRYYHQKLMRDPSALSEHSDVGSYTALLSGYDGFHAYVTSLYGYIAQGSFPKIQTALAKRKDADGVADMVANESAYAQRENDFIQNELPAIQREGTARVVDLYESSGRPDKALAVLAAAPEAIRAANGPQALQATIAYLKSPTPAPIDARLDAWQAYIAYLQATTHATVMTNDMFQVYRRDYIDAYNAKMAEARSTASPSARIAALSWAKGYLGFLPPEDQARLRKGAAPVQ